MDLVDVHLCCCVTRSLSQDRHADLEGCGCRLGGGASCPLLSAPSHFHLISSIQICLPLLLHLQEASESILSI